MLKQRFEYKEQAKSLMVGKYEPTIIILIIFMVFQSLIATATDQFRTKYEFDWTTGAMIMTQEGNAFLLMVFQIIGFLATAIILFASVKMYLGIARDQKPNVNDILTVGFKNDPLKSVVLHFMTSLFTILWTLLFIIPGIVKAYAYSMNFYLLHREPKLTAMEAIDKSKRITMGYKGDLFMLDLSYLGWYILGIFTLGILWLWIIPKHRTARILYFDEIYIQRVTSQEPKPMLEDQDEWN